ncbi:glycosyltransferase [Williamsia phyllosphaerae]|uniref:4,4'-diaponeurosporenoate glycosyltransferase n=1 Tax=Williamsia phyllosphaerae TaxID=885042 RepID=A0ABQ1UIB2_9NOCA|nr:glycosyltransferase family 2 protein [Williamsia phyllosphaerae]GGF19560.1 glycosyl transferase [Williamsia phyllosphaerae]
MLTPSLSVIIPTYNEQDCIEDCLRALLSQQEPVDEIIVVDNNSTDNTTDIVLRMTGETAVIRLIRAPEQGVINARSLGFDSARGEVLARIDADTHVPDAWSQSVRQFFATHSDRFQAGSGLCYCYDLPFQGRFRRRQQQRTAVTSTRLASNNPDTAAIPRLFGSNMAITQSAWTSVRSSRSHRTDIFEDLDLTLTIRAAGYRIALIPNADAGISGRRYLCSPRTFWRYCLRDQRTYRAHGDLRNAVLAACFVLPAQYLFYLLAWLPFRAYDPQTRQMTLRNIGRDRADRVLPSGNV